MSVECKTITVYLMRHAESSFNANLSGDKDKGGSIKLSELSELGREQIKNLTKVWKDVEFSKVYSSGFKRSVETAESILKEQDENGAIYEKGGKFKPEIEIEIDEDLREMDFGKLNTASYAEITLHYLSLDEPYFEWKYAGGETVYQVGRRMLNYVEKCCTNLFESGGSSENLNVLIVSHRVAIACFLYLLGNGPVDGGRCLKVEDLDWEKDIRLLRNTGYYKIEIWRVEGEDLRGRMVEKHVVGHLNGIEYGRLGEDERRRENEERLKERLGRESSERGRKVLGCSQQ